MGLPKKIVGVPTKASPANSLHLYLSFFVSFVNPLCLCGEAVSR
jgi:hypothetical protein